MKIILIGTSPAMLIHAILLSNKYKNIEIYEKENIIGGSWAGSDFMKYSGIETGSHIFAPWGNSNLYLRSIKIIEKLIGSKMPKLTPRPTKVLNNKINASELKDIEYYYINGGAPQIINCLRNIIIKKKINIILDHKVIHVSPIEENKKKIIFDNGKEVIVDQVYIPSYVNLSFGKSKNNKTADRLEFEERISEHIVVKFDYKSKLNFSYIQRPEFSSLIDRVANLSLLYPNINNNVICCRLSNEAKLKMINDKQSTISNILHDLINYCTNNYNGNADLNIKYKLYKYNTAYRNKEDLLLLKRNAKKNGCILVNTIELIQYIGENINDLERVLYAKN